MYPHAFKWLVLYADTVVVTVLALTMAITTLRAGWKRLRQWGDK